MNLECLQEVMIAKLIAACKMIFLTVCRSPMQKTEQYEGFINSLESTKNRKYYRSNMIILTGDVNCRSFQWGPQKVENAEGIALNELI